MVEKLGVHKEDTKLEDVRLWVVDTEALLMSPEVAREYDVVIPYHVLADYSKKEVNISKKEVVLQSIKKSKTKVNFKIPTNFVDLNTTEYGLITGDLSKVANTDMKRPVITPADKLRVGYTGVEYFDINDEKVLSYLAETGEFNGKSGQFVHDYELSENQYVILENSITKKGTKHYIVRNNQLDEIDYNSGVIRGVNGDKVTPRNDRQRLAMDLLDRRDVPLKLLSGVYGSGKDFLMLNKAVELISDPRTEFNKLVFIRNNTILEDVNDIGFLPSGLNEKLKPFMMPVVDICGGMDGFRSVFGMTNYELDAVDDNELDGDLNSFELVYLGHIKGRSWDNAIIYVTEAEDLSPKQTKAIISRAGEHTEVWMNGDEEQADTPKLKSMNGIHALKELRGDKMFGIVHLDKTERSRVARLAGKL